MSALNTAQKAVISQALDLMDGNFEKPLTSSVIEKLISIHAALGYVSAIRMMEDLRDKPFTVLLNALLATNS